MSTIVSAVPVISLSEGFGSLVVQGPNIKVEISADGHVNVHTAGRVTTSSAPASGTEAFAIGARMSDGSIYAGVSPDTGKPMYATSNDGPLTLTFDQAAKHASKIDAHGHMDWRVPTKAELNVLLQNRAAIGGFDMTGSVPAGWYWSSSRYSYFGYGHAWAQRFTDGYQNYYFRDFALALRCVRG